MGDIRRILIVDDHDFVGRGVAAQIRADAQVIRERAEQPELEVQADAVITLARAEKHLRQEGADLVLLDLNLEDGRSEQETVAAMREILARTMREAHLALFTGANINHPDARQFLKRALRENSIKGVLLKGMPATRVVEGLGRLVIGEDWFPAEVVRALAALDHVPTPSGGPQLSLTEREWEIAQLISEGLPNKRIASRLGVSDGHIRQMVCTVLDKLQAENRTQAAIKVLKNIHGLDDSSKNLKGPGDGAARKTGKSPDADPIPSK